MTPDMTTRYYGLKREMASSKHTLSILNEYGWSMARVCLERLSVRSERTLGPSGANSQSVGGGLRALRYVVMIALLMVVGVNGVKAQIAEGFYYIANNANKADNVSYSYNSSNPANSFYLCPAIGCYYDNNIDQPHLTTFKTNQDQNSLWKIVAVSGETNCYYLIHYKTGKYLASNETPNYNIDGNKNRKVVHLEKKAANDDSDIYKFYINNNSGTYQIYPKDYRPGGTLTSASSMSLNVKGDNWSMYVPYNGLATGIIGVYDYVTKGKANPGSQWKLEPLTSSQPCATPVIKFSGDQINISYPYSDETGITIYYTTDGSEPTTSSSSNTSTSFNISASGVVKVRAFAAKSGYVNSDEAVLWGSARPFLIQSKECADYYLVPAVNGTNVNTTSLAGEPMQWTLQNAGASANGMPYYYIVNSNGKKINYKSSDNTLTLNEVSEDAKKFCIIEDGNTGEFFIIPISGASTGNDKNCRAIYKNKGNVETDNAKAELIKADSEDAINRVHWLLRVCNDGADQKNLFSSAPFSMSNDDETHYYHIQNVGSSGYYIVPPSSTDGYATTSNTGYDDTPWLFKVADSDNWLTYYYIINAASGKYMYFNPNNNQTAEQENVISMKSVSEKNAGNEEKFQFIMVRSTTDGACYIVPKGYSYADASHRNFYNNSYFGLWFDDNNPASLKTTWSRSSTANNVKWTFSETTITDLYLAPVFSQDESGNITITHPTAACDIHYTTDGTEPSTSSIVYDNTNGLSSTVQRRIKAIAKLKTNISIVSEVATLLNKPDVTVAAGTYTYKGTAWEPAVTVSIGEGATITTAPSTPTATYNVTYSSDHTNVGPVTVTVADADANDNWYIWNVPTATFTIDKAPLTATADDITVSYGDDIPTYTAHYTGLVNNETDPGITTDPTFSCEYTPTSPVSSSYTITVSGGEATNYEITTYYSGTLTVNRATATVTADNKTKTYGETDPVLTATVTGLKNGDATSVISYTISRETGENAGDYTITPAGDATQGNYTVTYVTGTLTVNPAKVTLTANSGTETYDRTEKTVSGYTCNIDGLTFTEVSASRSETNAGTYEVTFTGVTVNTTTDDSGNYIVAEAIPGTLTINPKTLTITPDAGQYKGFGDSDPVITYTYNESQLVSGDVIGFDGALGREEGEDVGLYEITLGTLESTNTNYALAIVEGIYFRIKKSIGNGTIASGFTLEFGENTIILMDGETVLEEGSENDYTVSAITTTESGRYSQRTFNGVGNYTGYFTLRNANVTFQTDADRVEWSATFVAEPVGEVAPDDTKGHALPEGITAYIITGIMGDWAIPEPLNYIPEGIPVLLISNKESTGFKVDDASGHKPITTVQKDANMLKEVTTSTHFNAKTIYLLYKNEFVYNMDGDLAKGKVYLDPTTSTSPAPRLRINWDEVTRMTELQNNGITESQNDSWYTLDGRKLNRKPTQKGIYLVNGNKVIIR